MKTETQNQQVQLPGVVLERMADMLKILAHAHRLRIVEILEREGALPVHEMVARLELPQAVTSHHLTSMRRAGLLAAERRGKEVWYSVADPRSLTILHCIRSKQE